MVLNDRKAELGGASPCPPAGGGGGGGGGGGEGHLTILSISNAWASSDCKLLQAVHLEIWIAMQCRNHSTSHKRQVAFCSLPVQGTALSNASSLLR